MPQYTENVDILGSDPNVVQLQVQGANGQAQPLQTWEDSASTTLLEVTEDGRLKVGDDQALQAKPALVEAYREGTSTGKPQRGINTLGTVNGAQSDPVDWVAHELELSGSPTDVISSVHSAVQGRLTHQNSGDSSGATLRGGDFKVVNETGSPGEAVGLHAEVSNETGASLDKAVGVDVALSNAGTITDAVGIEVDDINQGTNNFAIRTGQGIVQFGDALELEAPPLVPGTPAANTVRVYPKTDSKLYAKTDDGNEYLLTGSQGTEVHTHENASEGGQLNASNVFNAGAVPHERGGLEADVSAFNGLVKIAGGVTSQAVAGTDFTTPTGSQGLSNKTITNSSIGTTAPSTGKFTTLNATSAFAFTQNPSAGKVLTSDAAGNASWQDQSWHRLASGTWNGASALLLSGIPANYLALRLIMHMPKTLNGNWVRVNLQPNSITTPGSYITGHSYMWGNIQASEAGGDQPTPGSVPTLLNHWTPGSVSNHTYSGSHFDVMISGYANSDMFTLLTGVGSWYYGTVAGASNAHTAYYGTWLSTSVVNSLRLALNIAESFRTNAHFSLYGLRE